MLFRQDAKICFVFSVVYDIDAYISVLQKKFLRLLFFIKYFVEVREGYWTGEHKVVLLKEQCILVIKQILTEDDKLMDQICWQTFSTPNYHPKSQPFIDHVFTFSVADNRIWFRNYQILEENGELAEIGELKLTYIHIHLKSENLFYLL